MTKQKPPLKMPSAETYEKELKFMPYRKSLEVVRNIVCGDAPRNGGVLDLMCGTGYLLNQLQTRRRDLGLLGLDKSKRYLISASINFPSIPFEVGDVLRWQQKQPFDVVLCTGALHHIPYEQQEQVVEKISDLTKLEGFAIISDCYIDDYSNEKERQLAAAKLGYEYLRATIKQGTPTPKDVVQATLDILANDVQGLEFKTSLEKRYPILRKNFGSVMTLKTWPNKQLQGYGDYIHILREPRK